MPRYDVTGCPSIRAALASAASGPRGADAKQTMCPSIRAALASAAAGRTAAQHREHVSIYQGRVGFRGANTCGWCSTRHLCVHLSGPRWLPRPARIDRATRAREVSIYQGRVGFRGRSLAVGRRTFIHRCPSIRAALASAATRHRHAGGEANLCPSIRAALASAARSPRIWCRRSNRVHLSGPRWLPRRRGRARH